MKGSGLEELFEEVYSEDTVKHISSGHIVVRALSAHLLVQSALANHITYTLLDENKRVIDGRVAPIFVHVERTVLNVCLRVMVAIEKIAIIKRYRHIYT